MGREVVIQLWCDACQQLEQRVTAERTEVLSVNGSAERELLMCQAHHKELLEPLLELLHDYGAPPQRLAVPPPPHDAERGDDGKLRLPCPICQRVMRQNSRATHVYAVHLGMPRPQQPPSCPDCGYVAPGANAASKSMRMGVHRNNSHGFDALAAALEIARQRGLT